MRARRPRFVLAWALFAGLAACGDGSEPGPGAWHDARLEGLANASDVAVDGGALLFVAGNNDRRLYVVPRVALRPGGVAEALALPLDVREEARVVGTDAFAGVGYTAGDLWSQPVDLQALAIQAPNVLYVADRSYRVVYSGSLERDAVGRAQTVRLARVFAIPGGDRSGRARSDWRDAGSGIAGLVALPSKRRSEDVFAVERQGAAENEVRVWRIDRFGQAGSWFEVAFPAGTTADVAGLAADGERLLLLRGSERATLARVPVGAWTSKVESEVGEDLPPPPPGSSWRGVGRSADGVTYLVSSGPECHVAWRADAAAPR